jgi:hypothetical protein
MFGFIDLPVATDCPQQRLRRSAAAMNALKADGRIEGGSLLMSALGMLPEPLRDRAAAFAASPRLYNVIVSNVPGPRVPLYAAGARVQAIHPVIPMPDRHALSIGVLTYGDGAHFSFYADPNALPGAGHLAFALEEALIELEDAFLGVRATPLASDGGGVDPGLREADPGLGPGAWTNGAWTWAGAPRPAPMRDRVMS